MWRHNSFSEIHDSDQSISDDDDEEEQGRKWSENCVSLAGTSDCKKKSLGVASQLELLKGLCQRDSGFLSEDEVEAPDFYKRNLGCENNVECDSIIIKAGGSTCDPNERTSSVKKGRNIFSKSIKEGNNVSEMLDLYTKGNEKQYEPCTSSEVDKEARRMDQLSERARWSTCHPFNSKNKNLGGRCKIKKKSSSLQLQKQADLRSVWKDKDLNSSSDDEILDKAEPSGYQPIDKICPVLLGGSDAGTSSLALPLEAAIEHDNHRRSMAELLDNLQGNTSNPIFKPKKGSRRKGRGKCTVIRSMTLLGKDLVSDEDPCEVMHSGSSTDNEDNAQNLALAIVESGRKSMADKFQEAFDCASVVDKRPSFTTLKQSSTGLFGRLQHIMQHQKEQDGDFLKKVQNEVWPKDEARCIDVKILSRFFDAKLSVCSCSLIENEESSLQNPQPQQENFGKIWTIIFNSRVCGDVNLEVGNLIRIYPPWKEVQVLKGGEIIILTLYFSQIHT
ncbi:uncharacterized protein LOC110727840 [Chenopodium quinoa]|uniref:uncharacterized protein LOC110727840 n=1 Tax=Chenopodium quinoa TaxID=63459 RepID=UPI000B76EEB4|nr:uncharacterized protein LOC110727840 [Chenopodium quinoa]XP_021763100.1 uncharacterized protein LOC110727840 [Chenopodium quinoa]XP_021763101.1 uncharacterized protein LOC110727840 [Chenopodium quinoa]XP_021763102.1 uncharacterized protein LOC110727840 [Chenopodium quinoa]XP_021763103.1 uncharacterized protein LOC110727840 [Chenopodium quinoa]XP_021763105.1 uncharacterized protein LOC110727840 [Chenopodium quinoa]XP_021763106.1 uncharacterized protein LOC110727840 [Chenopodium quinoa]